MDFTKELENKKEIILNTLKDLIAFPSVYDETTITSKQPFGKAINDCLEYMAALAKNDGFKVYVDDGYAMDIRYGNPNGKIVGVLGHLDVVPAGNHWTYPPFVGTIVGDKMYGRGTGDDKGPTLAAYYALKIIKDANIQLKNEIRLICGCDEETAWRGVNHYFLTNPKPDMAFSPDSSFPLIYGEKGRIALDIAQDDFVENDCLIQLDGGERYNVVMDKIEALLSIDCRSEFNKYLEENSLKGFSKEEGKNFRYILEGVSAHAMEPQNGVNACTYMCHFLKDYSKQPLIHYIDKYHHLSFYCEKLGLDYCDEEMGPITCNIGICHLSRNSSRLTLDLRYPINYSVDTFNKRMKEILNDAKLHITLTSTHAPHYVSKDSPLVKKLYQAYVQNTQDTKNQPFTVGGGTYAQVIDNAVAFGMTMPYEEDLCHQPDEYISINTFFTTIKIYIDAILALGEVDA